VSGKEVGIGGGAVVVAYIGVCLVVVVLASLAASSLFLCVQCKKLMGNITCATS